MQVSNERAYGPIPSWATALPLVEGALWLSQPFYQSLAPTGHLSSPRRPPPHRLVALNISANAWSEGE